MKITTFDRAAHRTLSAAINQALKSVGDTYGVDLTCAGGLHGTNKGMVKVEVVVRDNGSGISGVQADFNRTCHWFGLKPSDYGRQFSVDGTIYKITGVNPNAPKYPIMAERLYDGRSFKFTESGVKNKLAAAAA